MYCAIDPKGNKLKTDGFIDVDEVSIAHLQVPGSEATAGSNTAVLVLTALTTTVQAITTGITNPTTPRNLRVVGNAAGIVGTVTIKGTNYNSDSISETLTLSGITVVEGVKAFASVNEIDLPIQTNATGDEVSVGFGEKLGIPYKLTNNTVLFAFLNNVKEATVPTVTTDSEKLENNTIKLNSSLDGNVVDAYLLV